MVDEVRRALGIRRAGHAGTLDPFASGLLVMLVGRATRLSRYLTGLGKTYVGRIRLGVATDTEDATGKPTATSEAWRAISTAAVEERMASLTGRIAQTPPAYSAKKLGGERAYRLARQGKPVSLEATQVDVRAFALMGRDGSAVDFRADVGSGTYLRSLARDLGAALGCGAHLEALRRTAVGSFLVEDAVSLDALGPPSVRPAAEVVTHLAARDLEPAEWQAVQHGRSVAADGGEGGPVALMFEGQLTAVAELRGATLKPKVVLVGD